MVPAVCIVGKSKVGKTTLVEQLISDFKGRGYRVAAVKHASDEVNIDMPGKDTWRFARAGSDAVLASSASRLAFIKNTERDSSIGEILRIIGGEVDLVLIEGFKKGKAPKIEVHRKELGGGLVCPPAVLSAVASDETLDIDVPQFPLGDIKGIADFIQDNFISQGKSDISLWVNGEWVPTSPFVRQIITKTILGMVSTLKGVTKIRSLDISIRNKA